MAENEIIKAWENAKCADRIEFIEMIEARYGENLVHTLSKEKCK